MPRDLNWCKRNPIERAGRAVSFRAFLAYLRSAVVKLSLLLKPLPIPGRGICVPEVRPH